MSILAELRRRFADALRPLAGEPGELLDMVRASQDPRFGDYQANCAMPLAGRLKRPSKDVAADIVSRLKVDDLCDPPAIAGPGFVNLRVRDDVLRSRLHAALRDERLGIQPIERPRTFVIDYSAPNVAKPMHVGHIRSTVIGDSLYRVLKFLGHRVVGDNHVGDWGTQFGMIIFGYKRFLDRAAYESQKVEELARLYRLVNQLVEYHEAKANLPELQAAVAGHEKALRDFDALANQSPEAKKKAGKDRKRLGQRQLEARDEVESARRRIAIVENDATLLKLANEHPDIGRQVLRETAKLHAGDAENRRLWEEFLPACLAELDRVYRRMKVSFDHTLGESFYHERLAGVVEGLLKKGLARETDGAIGVFLEGHETPMLIRKQDGAFLYATSDLATIQHRIDAWKPDVILYVVDHRQGLHFEQLFAVARLWGYRDVDLKHVSFGTVLGKDGRPFKTREGGTVELKALLDEAVEKALGIVKQSDAGLTEEEQRDVAGIVGLGALKYADLSHNRTSDYVFDYDKMLSMTGNTATYMQYAYVRVRGIFRKGNVDIDALRSSGAEIVLSNPVERALALSILQFAEALETVVEDFRPNYLTAYLFDSLARCYTTFFENCPVLQAETESLRASRLLLCDLTARTLKLGLELLGIDVAERM
ncbi:MAG: arginine--tRNA ligase [Planctomycetia bacterium]|nr:arginine--tRNA ligase [Planctomycetia bacterium]